MKQNQCKPNLNQLLTECRKTYTKVIPATNGNKANVISQLELKLTSKLLEARENANDHVPIVLISLVSDWLIG